MTDLTRIANKFGTDKGTVAYEAHGYTEEYAKYIPNLGKYTLLEIGVWHCDSMRMWQDYNPDMNIVGVDIDPGVIKYIKKDDIYQIYVGNITNAEFVEKMMSEVKQPDFIIDDGSHNYQDIIDGFKLLWPHLKSGGYYFIEDLHAGHARRYDLYFELIKIYGESTQEPWTLVCNDKLLVILKP